MLPLSASLYFVSHPMALEPTMHRYIPRSRPPRAPALALAALLCAVPLLAQAQTCTSPNANADYILGDVGVDASAMNWNSGLVWKRCVEGMALSGTACAGTPTPGSWNDWAETQKFLPRYFAGQDTWGIAAGFSQNRLVSGDWRMAYLNELLGITQNCSGISPVNPTVFPDNPPSLVWSGSPDAGGSSYAWHVNFNNRLAYGLNRSNNLLVRLVRAGQSFAALSPSVAQQDTSAGTQVTFASITLGASVPPGQAWGGARISGAGSPAFRVNGGAWVQEAIVKSGDTLTVHLTAPMTAGSGHTATLALRSGQTTGTSDNGTNGGTEATTLVETTASFTVNTTGLTLPEGPQSNQPLGVALTPGNGWHIDSASTQTLASLNAPPLPPGLTAPHGVVSLQLSGGTHGSAATVVLTYPQALPPGTRYYKYGPTASPDWYEFTGAVINGNTITLTLTDGGNGDADGSANGFITDPGGPVVPMGAPAGAAGIPTLSQWALALLAALMGLVALGWLRGKRV